MNKFNLSILMWMLIGVFSVVNSSAQTRISFARGKSSATVAETLGRRGTGDSIKKFMIRGWEGQHLAVVVKAANHSVYANMSDSEGARGADFYYTLGARGDHEFIVENVGLRGNKIYYHCFDQMRNSFMKRLFLILITGALFSFAGDV